MSEFIPVSPDDLWPKAALEQFPGTVPVHGIAILDGLRPEGTRAVHVIHDTGAPVWVLVGLLKCVLSDLEDTWVSNNYQLNDEDDDNDF